MTRIEVSMRNYRWAKDRWPGRKVCVSRYEPQDTLTIYKPGFLYNPKLKRRIRIDNETLQCERKRTALSAESTRLVPKRGYIPGQ